MSDLLNTIADTINATQEAMNEMLPTNETTTPAAKADKPKGKAKAKPVELIETPKAEPAKPEPLAVDGFELKEGADITFLNESTEAAIAAIEAIGRKDKDLLSQYMALGMFQSSVAGMFKSTKIYGQYVAAKVPASASLDPALRSNCKWIYQAMNEAGNDASDILSVLKVNRLEYFKSANPTVIRREYKAAKDALEVETKAKEAGVSVEELEKEEQAEADRAKKLAEENGAKVFAAYIDMLSDKVKSVTFMRECILPVLMQAMENPKLAKEVLATMNSVNTVKGEKPVDDTDH